MSMLSSPTPATAMQESWLPSCVPTASSAVELQAWEQSCSWIIASTEKGAKASESRLSKKRLSTVRDTVCWAPWLASRPSLATSCSKACSGKKHLVLQRDVAPQAPQKS